MVAITRRNALKMSAAAVVADRALCDIRPAQAQDAGDPTAGRTLAFEENFATLDTTLWNFGRKATTFDSGHYGRAAFARISGEEGFVPYAIVEDAQAAGGHALQITAKYIGRPMNVYAYYGNALPEFQWVSGNLQTAKSDGTVTRAWRNGYFEARMRFPKHPLTWPGFWLMNGRSILFPRTSIEVDIVEHKGFEPRTYGAYLHEWGAPNEHHEGAGVQTPDDLTTQYFRYGVLIDGANCIPHFERKPVVDSATGKLAQWKIGRAGELDSFDDSFWPLFTLALRSDVPYPNPLRPEDHEAHMRVDYFRVYA